MIGASTASESPSLASIDLTVASMLRVKNVLHLHRLDQAQWLARLYGLSRLHVNRLDEAGHGTEQGLSIIRILALQHERGEIGVSRASGRKRPLANPPWASA